MANVSISEEDLFKFAQLMHSKEPLLYFIQSGDSGPIKIGVSKNIASRLNQLQTGHPEKLTVIGICKGGYFEEKRLHSVFAAFRRKGEWFTPHKKILEYVWDNSLIRSESVSVQLRDVKGGRPKQKSLPGTKERGGIRMSGSELLVLTRSEYKAMDYFHQAIADVGVRKGLVVIVEDDSNPIAEEIPKHLSTTKHDSSGSTAADSDHTIDVHIIDHSVFKNLSPLAQATAIVLERRGRVRIVRDEEEEGSTPPRCSNDASKAS